MQESRDTEVSYTTIVKVFVGEKIALCVPELKNAWGSAPVIWITMAREYLHDETKALTGGNELWDLWKNKDIPIHQRAVLMMTFDRAYVAARDYLRAEQDICKFLNDFPVSDRCANHWPAIALMFHNASNKPLPNEGIGFWMTSVSGNPFNGEWNDEEEKYGPLDWDEVYSVYDAIDENEKAEATK